MYVKKIVADIREIVLEYNAFEIKYYDITHYWFIVQGIKGMP